MGRRSWEDLHSIPQVVDIVKLPAKAAGGIADGRGLAAAFALRVEGVQIGTAFLPCAGSGASEAYRNALSSFAANGTDLTEASLPFYRRNRIYDSADRGSRNCLFQMLGRCFWSARDKR
jgi:NAD(P)H-dependent flavin oxidoreductase YrpB (nitropropane dioxygenase family)